MATVKIIPFAVTSAQRDAALAVARSASPLTRVMPYQVRKVGIVSTLLPGLAPKVIEKTLRVKKVGDPERGRIEAHSFSQLVRTANARLFRIRDRVEERYPEQGRAVVEKIWGDAVEAKNLGLFEPAAPQDEAGEPS